MLRNDTIPYPCEQVPKLVRYGPDPFKKSNRYDNGTISFPCERSLILLILVDVELPLGVVVTLSWNAVSCFLESS